MTGCSGLGGECGKQREQVSGGDAEKNGTGLRGSVQINLFVQPSKGTSTSPEDMEEV